jgi:opine dehydrogenase
MVKKIAVLGAGHGGHAASADLSLYGSKVNLCEFPEYESNIEPIIKRGGVEIYGSANVGFGKLDKATTNIADALEEDVDVIISTVVANAHRKIAELCAPYLRDGQVVMLWGKGGGTLVFKKVMKDKNVKANILLGETNSLPYGARRRGPALVEVLSPLKKGTLLVGFPAKDTERFMNVVRELYPDRPDFFAAGESVLENIMYDLNAVTHPAVTLCNAGRIEFTKGDFPHWGEGFTQSVAKLEAALDEERLAIVKTLGLTGASTRPVRSTEWIGPGGLLSMIKAPPTLDIRYITEDTPCGLVTYSSLGDMLGVETPVIDALITISVNGSAMLLYALDLMNALYQHFYTSELIAF